MIRPILTGIFGVLIAYSSNTLSNNDSIYLHTKWFNSTTSPALNRSTVALAGEHYRRGIYFALAALEKDLGETDQLIAHHNLCLAYLQIEKAEFAEKHCRIMNTMVRSGLTVQSERGAHRIVRTYTSEGNPDDLLSFFIINNIYINYGLRALAR